MLTEQRVDRKTRPNSANTSALAGRLYDETGDRLIPSHSKKGKVRYRYYVSQRLIAAKHGRDRGWWLPAKELEEAVFDVVNADPTFARLRQRAGKTAELSRRDVFASVQKATVLPGHLSVCFDPRGLLGQGPESEKVDAITAEGSFGQRRRGIELRMVLETDRPRAPDLTLVRMVHRATSWVEKLREGASASSIAAAENVQIAFISRRIHLGLLSPKIVAAIVEGKFPAHLTTQALIDMDLSMNWREQEAQLLRVS